MMNRRIEPTTPAHMMQNRPATGTGSGRSYRSANASRKPYRSGYSLVCAGLCMAMCALSGCHSEAPEVNSAPEPPVAQTPVAQGAGVSTPPSAPSVNVGPPQSTVTEQPQKTDDQWNQEAAQAATDMLEKTMLHQGNVWYVHFTLQSINSQPAPTGGFVQQVRPNAEQPVSDGLMEIEGVKPESSTLPSAADGGWRGTICARILQYRIYRPGRGWSEPVAVLIHLWEWTGTVQNGVLTLESQTDREHGTTDGGVTEFVASVFSAPTSSVTCSLPSAQDIPPDTSAQNPAR